MRPTVLFVLLSVFWWMENGSAFLDSDELDEQVFIILSLDSFHKRYFDFGITPKMREFRKQGVYAKSMKPRFPTKTFVNHFSIATGQPYNIQAFIWHWQMSYFFLLINKITFLINRFVGCNAGSHGVLGNELYDTAYGEVKYSYQLFHDNGPCTPIWTMNEMNEKISGCMMWPGSDFPYNGIHCTYFQKLDEKMSWTKRMEMVMKWILNDKKAAKLIMWYMEQPDSESHAYGTDSDEERDMIARLDHFIGQLQEEIRRNGLENCVNLIILSDHGMITVPLTNIIELDQRLTAGTYKFVGSSPVIQVIPNPGYEEQVWKELSAAAQANDSHFDAYNNDNVPEHWHVNNKRRIVNWAVSKEGWAFPDLRDLAKWFYDTRNITGNQRYFRGKY